MRLLFSKADLRAFSSILAAVILLTSAPVTIGVVIESGPSHPEFTVNICQPIQALDRTSNTLLARPGALEPSFVLSPLSSLEPTPSTRLVERTVAPDTPPPKPRA